MTLQSLSLSAEQAAENIAQVASTMLGCSIKGYANVRKGALPQAILQQARALPMSLLDDRFDMVMLCSQKDAQRLAARMLSKNESELSAHLVDDAASEWLNILAGQLKSLAGLDHAMGLPRVLTSQQSIDSQATGLQITLEGCNVTMWLGLTRLP